MGAWAATNPLCVEETAVQMREAHQKYLAKARNDQS
jgi:hypothetical protein